MHPLASFRKILNRFTKPITFKLWLVNIIFQRIFRLNSNYKWMIHFTSIVSGEIIIGKNVWISFASSGGCYIQGSNELYLVIILSLHQV